MPHPIVFQSTSRLLGTSASGDVGLYGAQPVDAVSFAAAPAGAEAHESAPSLAATVAIPTTPAAGLAPLTTPTAEAADMGESASMAVPPPSSLAAELSALADARVGPLNAFDLRPIVLDAPDHGAASHPSDGLAEATAPWLDHSAESPPVLAPPTVAAVDQMIGGTIGTAVGLVEPGVDTVTGLVEPLLGDVVGAVADVVTPLITTLGEVGHIGDNLVTDLLGADPAGGIATLVSMVNFTDLLDLRDAGAPGDPGVMDTNDPVGGLLDTLTTDLSELMPHDDHSAPVQPVHHLLGDLMGDHHDLGLGLGG